MENWTLEVLKQVPSLAVLAWVVMQFLKDRRERDREVMSHERERDKQMLETLAHIGDDCHVVQRDSIAVMNETKIEIGRMREATTQLLELIARTGNGVGR